MSGISGVVARVAELQGRLELAGPAANAVRSAGTVSSGAPLSTAPAATATTATTAAGFSTALDAALAAQTLASSRATPAPATALADPATGDETARSISGTALLDAAKKYLGVPYVWGGEDRSGMDCSGLVQRAFADLGITVPRVARDQMTLGTPVASLAEAQPGDLVVQRGGGHIGIFVGGNTMLHAPQRGDEVRIGPIYSTPTAIRRVLTATGGPA